VGEPNRSRVDFDAAREHEKLERTLPVAVLVVENRRVG
jgi:hypothetical protein